MASPKPTGHDNDHKLVGYMGRAVPVQALEQYDVDTIDIDNGAFGVIKRATDTCTGADFALKVPVDMCNDGQRAALLHEARTLADIGPHACVTPMLAAVAPAARPDAVSALLLPFATEGDLAQWLSYGKHSAPPVNYAGTLAAAATVLAALDHVHAAGYAHLDLKPGNLLLFHPDVAEPGAVKLADFGLARRLGSEVDSSMLGTLGYMPPELATPGVHVVAAAMDVHAFGVVLLELAAQQCVRLKRSDAGYAAVTRSGGLFKALVKHLGGMHGCDGGAGGVPASLLAVAEACMARDPAARPSVAQLRRHFADLANWDACKPELPRGTAAAAPPPAVAPAAASAWAQLPAEYAAALRVGKLKPLAVPMCVAGSAGGCASPTIGACRVDNASTANASHGQPPQPPSPPVIAVQRHYLPSTLASGRAVTRLPTASVDDDVLPLTSDEDATAGPTRTPAASSARLVAEPGSLAAARSVAAYAADSSAGRPARDGGATAGPSGRTPGCSSACSSLVSRAAAALFGDSTANPMPPRSGGAPARALHAALPSSSELCTAALSLAALGPSESTVEAAVVAASGDNQHQRSMAGVESARECELKGRFAVITAALASAAAGGAAARSADAILAIVAALTCAAPCRSLSLGQVRPGPAFPLDRCIPTAVTAATSGLLETAAATSGSDSGELRRPHSRAAWARAEQGKTCGAVAALAAAAWLDPCAGRSGTHSHGAVSNSTEDDSDESAFSDWEDVACAWEERYYAHAARCKAAKRQPACGGRAAGKRTRR